MMVRLRRRSGALPELQWTSATYTAISGVVRGCREYDTEERRCLAGPGILVSGSEVVKELENLGEWGGMDDIEYSGGD